MRTETYKTVRDAVARLRGKDPTALDTKTAAEIAQHITDRCREAIEYDYWPELTPCEERQYRSPWASGTTYSAPTASAAVEVFYPASGGYYQALRASTGQAPATLSGSAWVVNTAYWAEVAAAYAGDDWATGAVYAVADVVRNPSDGRYYACHTAHTAGGTFDATKFGILTPWRPYVALDQASRTAIGEVLHLFRRDPRVYRGRGGLVLFTVGAEGIVPAEGAPASVWIEFRVRPPRFTSTAYSSSTAYVAGDLVYYATTGECYQALASTTNHAPTDTTYWRRQELPYVVSQFVQRAALADGLRCDNQSDRAALEESRAYEFLLRAHDAAFAGQGQFDPASVRTY